jgi:hypothetical protein
MSRSSTIYLLSISLSHKWHVIALTSMGGMKNHKVYQDDQAQSSDSVVKAEIAHFETNSDRTPGESSGARCALLTSEKWR